MGKFNDILAPPEKPYVLTLEDVGMKTVLPKEDVPIYEVKKICGNCGVEITIQVPKSYPAGLYIDMQVFESGPKARAPEDKVVCPHCECTLLSFVDDGE